MQQGSIVFDFGETIDRKKYCRWHFCRYDERFIFGFGTLRLFLN